MEKKTFEIIKKIWFASALLGIVGIIIRIFTGERMADYGSYIPWGLWVAIYFHAVGISGGIFAIGIFYYLKKIPGFHENLRVILIASGASLLTGLLAIGLDLGHILRAYRFIISPNFGSMLAFNGWMYIIFIALLVAVFKMSLNKESDSDINDRSGWMVPLLIFGIGISVAFPSQSGALFGIVEAKPFWNSAMLPVLFLASAVTSGASALILIFYFLSGGSKAADISINNKEPFNLLRRIILVGIAIYFIGEFSEYSVLSWSPTSHEREAVLLILFGSFWWVFWIVHIIGTAAGAYLIYKNDSLKNLSIGALVITISFISARLNIMIPGQSFPELRGLREAFTGSRLGFDYNPTIYEYLIALFIITFGIGIFYFGIKMLFEKIEKDQRSVL